MDAEIKTRTTELGWQRSGTEKSARKPDKTGERRWPNVRQSPDGIVLPKGKTPSRTIATVHQGLGGKRIRLWLHRKDGMKANPPLRGHNPVCRSKVDTDRHMVKQKFGGPTDGGGGKPAGSAESKVSRPHVRKLAVKSFVKSPKNTEERKGCRRSHRTPGKSEEYVNNSDGDRSSEELWTGVAPVKVDREIVT